MATTPGKLKYLFVAEYKDGSSFIQPENDQSKNHDPKSEWNPSAFSDVKLDQVIRFHLAGREGDDLCSYTVDLRDGHFEIDGVSFITHDQGFEPKDLKLVFWREVAYQTVQNSKGDTIEERHFVNRYFLGWESGKGKNKVRRTIGVQ